MLSKSAETLTRGMEILSEQLGIVEAEAFIYLIKSEDFDYTKWQRERFGSMEPAELDKELNAYFDVHPYRGAKAL